MFNETFGGSRKRLRLGGLGLIALGASLGLSGCGGNYSSAGPGQPAFVPGAPTGGGGGGTGGTPSVSKSIPAGGGTVTLPLGGTASLSVNFPAGSVPAGTPVTVTQVTSATLPVSLAHARIAHALSPHFTPNPNNVYVVAFQILATGVTVFSVPANVTGGSGLPPTGLPANTVLNLAKLQGGTYVDVATVTTTATGGLTQQQASVALAGITSPGTYVLYQPAQGTNTAVANFGIALIADDGRGPGNLQVVNLYDTTVAPLATPKLNALAFSGASDLDGQALTPDGSQGILVDGGNTVRFFSGVNTGVPVASLNTVDITSFGGDGDSVAILPNGDEAIVSGDSTDLLVISGILGGSPKPATTFTAPNVRDGLAISNDGRALLARGADGLTAYSITAAAPVTGSLGGTVSHAFTQVADLPSLGTGGDQEDGRDGIAFSPNDGSRAVVIGDSSAGTTISLLTGLGSTGSPTVASLRLRLPAARASYPRRREHRHSANASGRPHLALTGVARVQSVAITPDGTTAVVGTDAGIVLVSGVNTGALTQVGVPYNPTYTTGGTSQALGLILTLGLTLDGKYVVAITGNGASASLLVIPIGPNGLGAPVGQLDGIAPPSNDQILIH